MSDNRGWVYLADDGTVIYRAYSLGSCTRSLVAARLGETAFPFHPSLRAAMDASSDTEADAIREYEKVTGHKVLWQQKTVELPLTIPLNEEDGEQKVVIRGHIDGLDQEDDCIIEVKCLSGRNFAEYETNGLNGALSYLERRYSWQAAIYGHATGRQVRWVIYNKHAEGDDDRIIIEPALAPEHYVSMDELVQQVKFIEMCAAMDDLPPCDANCRESDPYGESHMFDRPAAVTDNDIEDLISRHHTLNVSIKELQLEKEEISDELKQRLGPGKHTAGRYTAQVVHVNGTRFDTSAFKKRHRDLYEEFTVPNPSVRLTITEQSSGKEAG